jgi:hypoxanthine phosphoribosyltransferase
LERNNRIQKNNREDFDLIHCVEHIDLLIYLFHILDINKQNSIINILHYFLATGIIIPSIYFKIVNIYLYNNYKSKFPVWFDNRLKEYYTKKITNNYNSNNIANYIVKIYSPKLNWNFMSWNIIEKYLDKLYKNIHKHFIPNIIVGVLSGGAFCVKYLANKFKNKNVFYIKCKHWSGKNILHQAKDVSNYFTKSHKEYLTSKNKITDFNNEINEYMNIIKIQNIKILLFDDTVSSGKTINNTKKFLKKKFKQFNPIIKTACMITNCVKYVDYFTVKTTIPIMWEWGVELD